MSSRLHINGGPRGRSVERETSIKQEFAARTSETISLSSYPPTIPHLDASMLAGGLADIAMSDAWNAAESLPAAVEQQKNKFKVPSDLSNRVEMADTPTVVSSAGAGMLSHPLQRYVDEQWGGYSTTYGIPGIYPVPKPGAQQQKRPRLMYECAWNGCEKAYGTLYHLNVHVTVQSHGTKRTPEGKTPLG